MENEKQSPMQSPVSMATAKSDLFASYRNCIADNEEDADMANGGHRAAAQRGAMRTCEPSCWVSV